MILITGSQGLLGTALGELLAKRGVEWRGFDISANPWQDTRNPVALEAALEGVTGIVHLAAVSRVVWAQEDPQRTIDVNVKALETLLRLADRLPVKPWLIFASSREVYGEQTSLPVKEDSLLDPLNVYARSKVRGEELVTEARATGLRTQIARFSNVYGSVNDHQDRVVPAFARTAVHGGVIRMDGASNTFDFTHVSDSARGLDILCDAMGRGEQMPPIHFLTGTPTTLEELAQLALCEACHPIKLTEAPPRNYDVSRFYGDPGRAKALLGWSSEISLSQGFAQLVQDFEMQNAAKLETEPHPWSNVI